MEKYVIKQAEAGVLSYMVEDSIVYYMEDDKVVVFAMAGENCLTLYKFNGMVPLKELSSDDKTNAIIGATSLIAKGHPETCFGTLVVMDGTVKILIVDDSGDAHLYNSKMQFESDVECGITEFEYEDLNEFHETLIEGMRGLLNYA